MKIIHSPTLRHDGDGSAALHRWTRARRHLDHDDLTRELLAELRRVRGELAALRLVLERQAA